MIVYKWKGFWRSWNYIEENITWQISISQSSIFKMWSSYILHTFKHTHTFPHDYTLIDWHTFICSTQSIMIIVVRNGISDPSSNPR